MKKHILIILVPTTIIVGLFTGNNNWTWWAFSVGLMLGSYLAL